MNEELPPERHQRRRGSTPEMKTTELWEAHQVPTIKCTTKQALAAAAGADSMSCQRGGINSGAIRKRWRFLKTKLIKQNKNVTRALAAPLGDVMMRNIAIVNHLAFQRAGVSFRKGGTEGSGATKRRRRLEEDCKRVIKLLNWSVSCRSFSPSWLWFVID